MMRRKRGKYFDQVKFAPIPISFMIKRRVNFSEVDIMGRVWYGRYPLYFEEASQELGRRCGLSFQDFYQANLRAPIAQFHIDYHQPLRLDEEFTVRALSPWCEGAKLLTEYEIRKIDGSLVASAYTVQMFIDSRSENVCIATPKLLEDVRQRWRKREFKCLK
ncbi:MAG: acyl-CoA thioesterase [Candidatus Omnitrophica bacterium]|nr:acyl-CoA thioesterase [Candidatus Omnitrophota bacterium]